MDEKLKEAYDGLIMYKIHSIFAFPVFDDHEMIGLISIHNPDAAKQRKELTFTQYLDDYADKYAAMLGYRRKTQNRA